MRFFLLAVVAALLCLGSVRPADAAPEEKTSNGESKPSQETKAEPEVTFQPALIPLQQRADRIKLALPGLKSAKDTTYFLMLVQILERSPSNTLDDIENWVRLYANSLIRIQLDDDEEKAQGNRDLVEIPKYWSKDRTYANEVIQAFVEDVNNYAFPEARTKFSKIVGRYLRKMDSFFEQLGQFHEKIKSGEAVPRQDLEKIYFLAAVETVLMETDIRLTFFHEQLKDYGSTAERLFYSQDLLLSNIFQCYGNYIGDGDSCGTLLDDAAALLAAARKSLAAIEQEQRKFSFLELGEVVTAGNPLVRHLTVKARRLDASIALERDLLDVLETMLDASSIGDFKKSHFYNIWGAYWALRINAHKRFRAEYNEWLAILNPEQGEAGEPEKAAQEPKEEKVFVDVVDTNFWASRVYRDDKTGHLKSCDILPSNRSTKGLALIEYPALGKPRLAFNEKEWGLTDGEQVKGTLTFNDGDPIAFEGSVYNEGTLYISPLPEHFIEDVTSAKMLHVAIPQGKQSYPLFSMDVVYDALRDCLAEAGYEMPEKIGLETFRPPALRTVAKEDAEQKDSLETLVKVAWNNNLKKALDENFLSLVQGMDLYLRQTDLILGSISFYLSGKIPRETLDERWVTYTWDAKAFLDYIYSYAVPAEYRARLLRVPADPITSFIDGFFEARKATRGAYYKAYELMEGIENNTLTPGKDEVKVFEIAQWVFTLEAWKAFNRAAYDLLIHDLAADAGLEQLIWGMNVINDAAYVSFLFGLAEKSQHDHQAALRHFADAKRIIGAAEGAVSHFKSEVVIFEALLLDALGGTVDGVDELLENIQVSLQLEEVLAHKLVDRIDRTSDGEVIESIRDAFTQLLEQRLELRERRLALWTTFNLNLMASIREKSSEEEAEKKESGI
ncbi:hypothetical protein JCM17960_05160 [Magnetospira thiophila]